MMIFDSIFNNVKHYNVNRLDVLAGETFSLISDSTEAWDVFANNDKVLDIDKSGNGLTVKAKGSGTSVLKIYDQNNVFVRDLTISVLDEIAPQATTLGLSVEEPK